MGRSARSKGIAGSLTARPDLPARASRARRNSLGPAAPVFASLIGSRIARVALSKAVGTPLNARGPQGEELLIHVSEVKDETVVLDFNHPLAGKTLNFDVKVVDIEPKEV